MKKLIGGKIGNPVPASGQSSCIGKSFTLGKLTVSVEEVIAEGGFGVVFLARHGAQKYALKRILVNNDQDLSVGTREIQFMTQLNHPNMLPCVDFLVSQLSGDVTEILMLMPYIKGSLLATLNAKMSAKSHLTDKEVLQIMGDVVAGVSRIHQCATPVVHRDLKIENILEEDGKYIICDFGSATAKFWDPQVHGFTQVLEDLEKYTTLAYRSPEMVDPYSNRGPITTKADIWALGVLLYKTCFYTTPFEESILAIQSAKLTFPPGSPFSLQIHALIYYLLTPDQDLRPDIYQVAELVYHMLGVPNPVKNVNGSDPPPSIDELVSAMNDSLTAKTKAEERPIKSASVTPSITPLETSVTPRQRPKGNSIALLPTPVVGASLLPPPKSPTTTVDPHGHRRNASDSSAFEKNTSQVSEMSSASSERAISSWNPFDNCTANSGETCPSESATTGAAGTDENNENCPFENAPFGPSHDYFKYRPMPVPEIEGGGVDLFGSAPFSNPFLEFSQPEAGVTNLSFEDER